MGQIFKDRCIKRPVRLYGFLEGIIGLSGLLLGFFFQLIERLDTHIYEVMPDSATLVHILGIVASLGLPTLCMGATLPVLGLVARQYGTSIAILYGLNTLGAALGALCAAFVLIPLLGITHTAWAIATVNIAVGMSAWLLSPGETLKKEQRQDRENFDRRTFITNSLIVLITGYATFSLEVAWFRSLTAAFQSATDAFAIMLASVLIGLGAGARLVPVFKTLKLPLGVLIAASGILIFLATPVIERFDIVVNTASLHPKILILNWFVSTLSIIGIPILLLGVALPWIMDDQRSTRKLGILYSINALSGIAGALCAGWILLPTIGFARTAWVAGGIVAITGIINAPREKRAVLAMLSFAALSVAVMFESGVGRTRVQRWYFSKDIKPDKILESYEGPNATVTAVGYKTGGKALIIDGFVASTQYTSDEPQHSIHYMLWMGHLPMLVNPHPHKALVICFGTGQTANAVRNENPQSLDIVDLNPQVLKIAHNFTTNEGVLDDPRVKTTVMDGRAYIRRTDTIYDVITLEPMPPNFAGVNALYSQEFYKFARSKLSPEGTIAQWVPFHLVGPHYSLSIVKTFQSVFPNAVLWLDPGSKTGILLGSKNDDVPVGSVWPGYAREGKGRDMTEAEARQAMTLDSKALRDYSDRGEIITDDNQLLAYGEALTQFRSAEDLQKKNMELLTEIKAP